MFMSDDQIYPGESHPHQWLDDILNPASESKDPAKIMAALANSPRLLDAVHRGIAESAKGGMGSCLWQAIRQNLQTEIASADEH